MSNIKVIPNVLIHRLAIGASLTGVDPTGTTLVFDYDNEAGGPFTVGESLTWTGGSGVLSVLVDSGTTGTLTVLLSTGVAPSDGLTITGVSSSATCDVDGTVTETEFTDNNETVRRGRYRAYSNLSDGGLVTIPESVAYQGYRVRQVFVTIPGMTAIDFYVVDRDGYSVSAGSVSLTSGSGYKDWTNYGVLVAPGCKFRVVGTGAATAVGEIMMVMVDKWQASIFDQAGELGSSNLPPGMVRP